MQHMGEGAKEFLQYLRKLQALQQELKQDGSISQPITYPENTTTAACSKCNDEGGYLVKTPEGTEAYRICECNERKRIERIFKSSAFTDEAKKLGFGNFLTDGRPKEIVDAKAMALKYYHSFSSIQKTKQNSIALLGQPGSGKTHLLTAIANNFMAKGITVHYFPWIEGMNDLKSDWDELERKVRRLQTVDVLYLDDLFKGREKPTPFQIEQAFAIINYRYLNNLPILVSAERDFETLMNPDYGDEALGSRLYEMCRDYTTVLDGRHLNHRLR